VIVTVVIFAIVHYYVAIFSETQAYHGIETLTKFELSSYPPLWRLTTPPSWETVVNCIYFSTVTMATVGYGDIYPITPYAKMATTLQIVVSFGLIAVILAWAIGRPEGTAPNQK
jgi:Ion channel